MLGVEVHSPHTAGQLTELLRGLPHATVPTVLLSVIVVGGIYLLQALCAESPRPHRGGGYGGSECQLNFAGHGIAVIGPIVGGLPHLALPNVSWRDIESLLAIAASCVVVIVAQSAATSRVYAMRHQQAVDEDVNLVGLSAANAAAALSGTFVVNGSPTQTAMVESSGGRSQLAQSSLPRSSRSCSSF